MFCHLKILHTEQVIIYIFSSNRNKTLQCYDSWKNFFDQPVKNKLRTYKNIRKFATVQGDNFTTDCLLDYPYFKEIS